MVHVRHGHLRVMSTKGLSTKLRNTDVLQYKIAPSPIRSRPASRRAFSSACRQRQSSLEEAKPLQRAQPPSLQLMIPRGVPLYLGWIDVNCHQILTPILRCVRTLSPQFYGFAQELRQPSASCSLISWMPKMPVSSW